jgi:hypothetical protein
MQLLQNCVCKTSYFHEECHLLGCDAVWILYERRVQDPHGATSQETAFFIVTAGKTSNPIGYFRGLHPVACID